MSFNWLNKIEYPANLLFIGKTNTGKSHMAKFLLYACTAGRKQSLFNYGVVISNTIHVNPDWNCVPKGFQVTPAQSEDMIKKVVAKQTQYPQLKAFIIIDDSIGCIDWNAPHIQQLYTTGRHYRISIFTISQYLYSLKPIIRNMTSYYFLLKTITQRDLKAYYEQCFSFMKYQEFLQFVQHKTDNYGCILVDSKTNSNDPNQMISVVRAPAQIPNFYLNF
jgi:hypothetical protein